MNPPSQDLDTSSPSVPQSRHLKVAALACEICRTRKQKCDEERPTCGTCRRLHRECIYREPQPTKKDKTLVEILDRLDQLLSKIDQIPVRGEHPSGEAGSGIDAQSHHQQNSNASVPPSAFLTASLGAISRQSSYTGSTTEKAHKQATSLHRVLQWPATQEIIPHLFQGNVSNFDNSGHDGVTFLAKLSQGWPPLSTQNGLHIRLPSQVAPNIRNTTQNGTVFTALDGDTMWQLATSFFETVNILYPFMDRQTFMQGTLAKVKETGFQEDSDSVIALLVFALGEVAKEGTSGISITKGAGRARGVRGGTESQPPALALFTEAKRRMGLMLTECELEHVQMFSLTALYYQSCFRHQDFWQSVTAASMACKFLVACHSTPWESARGEMIKRAYWHCVIMETGLNLEFDLPLTGLSHFDEIVPMPDFNNDISGLKNATYQASYSEECYVSQLVLECLCIRLQYSSKNFMHDLVAPFPDEPIPSISPLHTLAGSLSQWRGTLPMKFQWADDAYAAHPMHIVLPVHTIEQSRMIGSSLQTAFEEPTLFTRDSHAEPLQYPYLYDIQVALLRSRYYYAKYIVNRPFIYKALHFPQQMGQIDREGVADCLKACLQSPLLLFPVAQKKRLIPHVFRWSQHFLETLLVLHLTEKNQMLMDIRTQLCGAQFDNQLKESIQLMLDWIVDLKDNDPLASWCLQIVEIVYQ